MNKAGQRLKLGQSQSINLQRTEQNQYINTDSQDDVQFNKRQQSFEEAMQMNVKDHIDKSETGIYKLKDDLNQSRNDINYIRDQLIKVNNDCLKNHHSLTQYICDEINRIQSDLRKGGHEDFLNTDSITLQYVQLRIDKEVLDEQYRLTELKTQSCENEVGFKRLYD